jgi:hypothetical protein
VIGKFLFLVLGTLKLMIAGGERIRQLVQQMQVLIWRCQALRNGGVKCFSRLSVSIKCHSIFLTSEFAMSSTLSIVVLLPRSQRNAEEKTADTPETAALLRKIGGDSIVLMKNEDNILPLKKDKKVKGSNLIPRHIS